MNLDQTSADQTATDRIRQGETGHHVRYILGFGTLLVVLGFAIMAMLTL